MSHPGRHQSPCQAAVFPGHSPALAENAYGSCTGSRQRQQAGRVTTEQYPIVLEGAYRTVERDSESVG
ncbi:MAG: hypothetical protein ACYDDZ_03720 [Acidimicrobiales bacterium]